MHVIKDIGAPQKVYFGPALPVRSANMELHLQLKTPSKLIVLIVREARMLIFQVRLSALSVQLVMFSQVQWEALAWLVHRACLSTQKEV